MNKLNENDIIAKEHADKSMGGRKNPPDVMLSMVVIVGIWLVFLVIFTAMNVPSIEYAFYIALCILGIAHYRTRKTQYGKWFEAYRTKSVELDNES